MLKAVSIAKEEERMGRAKLLDVPVGVYIAQERLASVLGSYQGSFLFKPKSVLRHAVSS